MDPRSSTVLITGGSTGIGLALAKRFAAEGATVAVCGRRASALEAAAAQIPGLRTYQADVAQEADRLRLFESVTADLPGLNVVINNAGIQVMKEPYTEGIDWAAVKNQLAINVEAPVHLCALFVPFLLKQPQATLVNVTSGLAFVPIAAMPTYCASKAALHSFTLSLRHQLRETSVAVVELAPPAVDTDLGAPGMHTFGVNVDEFADHAFAKLKDGDPEFGYGMSERARLAGREALEPIFQALQAPR